MTMPIRNLKDGKHLSPSMEAFEELQRRAEEVLTRYQGEPGGTGAETSPDRSEDPTVPLRKLEETSESLQPEVGIDLKTPPLDESEASHDSELDVGRTRSDEAVESTERIDDFMASLEALRSTLRSGSKPDKEVADETREASETDEKPAPLKPIEDEGVSALDRMPLPDLPGVPQAGGEATDAPKEVPEKSDYEPPESSLDEAMRAVRASIAGEIAAPVEYDTPPPKAKDLKKRRKKRPLSDGIPKSVSEDLPKFRSRPKMRICNRCGHETHLREPRCGKCGHTDESLGILDAVIAGDLARVEQILLARPHLIGVRTSRHEWTLLHMAASGGNPKMVELLIKKGASVNATNKDGKTSLHYAAGKGHLDIVKALLANHADTEVTYHGKTCEQLAREHHQDETAKYLAEYRSQP